MVTESANSIVITDQLDLSAKIELEDSSVPMFNLRSRVIETRSYKNGDAYNSVKLHEVAKIADRYNVHVTVAAAMATATLVDFAIVSPENKQLIVHRHKVHRSRKRLRKTQINQLTFDGIQGLYFDGRKDQTLEFKNNAKKVIKEEHISFVQQPNSFYIGHKAVKMVVLLHLLIRQRQS